jgi:PTS system nitrogen regulatory IIA component
MNIREYLQQFDIVAELKASNKDELLVELATTVAETHPALDRDTLTAVLREREKLGSTGIGDGIAIPHGKLKQARELVLAFGRSKGGVEFNALDGRPVQLFFLLVAPEEAIGVHLKMLARISRVLKDPAVRRRLIDAADAAEIYSVIIEQDSRS